LDAGRAWEPGCAFDPAWLAAGAAPFPAAPLPDTVPKSAIMPGIATMLCVPRPPARPAVPTILVAPFLAVPPWP